MEFRYILTFLNILISTQNVFISCNINEVYSAVLMGGHLDNKNNFTLKSTNSFYEHDLSGDQVEDDRDVKKKTINSEEIPDPSALVSPGYNLPENIFNHGKPFYVEKDPLTGRLDFAHKSSTLKLESDLHENINKELGDNIYDKTNIDRNGDILNSHKLSDVNQLTTNFHDFLNLPVKYNSEKYMYPLVSNSYASTKVQGMTNKFHNHKDSIKTTTEQSTGNPTYSISNYFNPSKNISTAIKRANLTTDVPVNKMYSSVHIEPKPTNLMNSQVSHPSSNEDFNYYDEPVSNFKQITTESTNNNIFFMSKSPVTTSKIPSLFEELFGNYDEIIPITVKSIDSTTHNIDIPNISNENIVKPLINTEKVSGIKRISTIDYENIQANPNIVTETSMELDNNYEYEDYESDNLYNADIEDQSTENIEDLKIEPLNIENNSETNNHKNDSKIEINSKEELTTVSKTDILTTTNIKEKISVINTTTTIPPVTAKVTALPFDKKKLEIMNADSIVVATKNLRENLNSEKFVLKPFEIVEHTRPFSASNVHVAPDQDIISLVVRNHQNVDNVDNNQYISSSIKESPYETNHFGHSYEQHVPGSQTVQNYPGVVGAAITIQPLKHSEASLIIGLPVNEVKQIPGQIVDEKLEIKNNPVGNTNSKNDFPGKKQYEFTHKPYHIQSSLSNSDILSLNSEAIYHQLPSDLTPPKKEGPDLKHYRPIRPHWEPRPLHFHPEKLEYNRRPRPSTETSYKRIDNLPNILPQFRPNMNKYISSGHYISNKLVRQPLLERPSNKLIGIFEKLQPPLPVHKDVADLRNVSFITPTRELLNETEFKHDKIFRNEGPKKTLPKTDHFGFYQPPPQIKITNRRNNSDINEIATLQMIQVKNIQKHHKPETESLSTEFQVVNVPTENNLNRTPVKQTIYKVYPVNTSPIELDKYNNNKNENIIIGTRSEFALPPLKNNKNFTYEHNPIFDVKDRDDAPILKPQVKVQIKSDFPYPLERPIVQFKGPKVTSNILNGIDDKLKDKLYESTYLSNNQWDTITENMDSNGVNNPLNAQHLNKISVTLKTFTEKPIAIAYTPTESNLKAHKHAMLNYESSEIPLGSPENNVGYTNTEFTVGAIIHTHQQSDVVNHDTTKLEKRIDDYSKNSSHKNYIDTPDYSKFGFEAPFQASISIDHSINHGWTVVKKTNKTATATGELTTVSYATTTEFDIENFKPELEGGFKPIYNFQGDAETTSSKKD